MPEESPKPAVVEVRVQALGKAEIDGLVQSNAAELEDEYHSLYQSVHGDRQLIKPPHNLKQLAMCPQVNNALGPCVEAMVTNIAGTGYEITPTDDKKADAEDDRTIKDLEDFFAEPWPGMSFTTIRKNVRRDIEQIGNGYIEVMRNPAGEIVFLRHVEGTMIRMARLDAPVTTTKTVRRRGKDVSIKVSVRERRFAQRIGSEANLIWFKEFGATRDLDKNTGEWAPVGQRLPANRRATELIHFKAIPDVNTPYGVPRWIAQTPSVIGSRKAEEMNVEFFNSGGVPPALVIVHGGVLGEEAARALEELFSGVAKKKQRVKVIEAHSTSGDLNSANNVRVTVERFGSERQQDAMFMSYDKACEEHVRTGFRLPPIFIGKASDYSFATAYSSYTVGEEQVFKSERDEEDEVYTNLLLPELVGNRNYKFRSRPMRVKDANLQMKGVEIAKDSGSVDHETLVHVINEVTNLNLKVSDSPTGIPLGSKKPATQVPTQPTAVPATDPSEIGKKADIAA